MYVVFLAAGRGLRMGSLTNTVPKALIALPDGRSILETNLSNIVAARVPGTVIVVGGYCIDAVRDFCQADQTGLHPRPVMNGEFATAGPIRSIAVGLQAVESDSLHIVVGNGDTVFTEQVFAAVNAAKQGFSLVVSEDKVIEPDDMGIVWDPFGNIIEAVKSTSDERSGYVSAGLLSARGADAVSMLFDAVEELSATEKSGKKFLPWHDILPVIYRMGAPAQPIPVSRKSWREFDYQECLARYADEL